MRVDYIKVSSSHYPADAKRSHCRSNQPLYLNVVRSKAVILRALPELRPCGTNNLKRMSAIAHREHLIEDTQFFATKAAGQAHVQDPQKRPRMPHRGRATKKREGALILF
ncbi:hypothetical protein GCM10008164_24630 [Achromobacter xylosoxidans]|nr:hypothetical protein GCM10008164_24630 [Achromobacter xylosoxidans]